jgi:hypothetical protein
MVVFVEHAAESVASSYAKAGDLVRSRERRGQWLEQGSGVFRDCPDLS